MIPNYVATICSEEEYVQGGEGATPDEAFTNWCANHAPDDVPNLCMKVGDVVEVEIWTTKPADPEEEPDYTWMLDKKVEVRNYAATKEDLES